MIRRLVVWSWLLAETRPPADNREGLGATVDKYASEACT